MSAPAVLTVAGIALLTITAGCETSRERSAPGVSSCVVALEGDGVFVRHLRLRVAPSDIEAFEELMHRCVAAAEAAGLPEEDEWLCYVECPGRYWLITFSETVDGFTSPSTLDGFVRHATSAAGGAVRDEASAQLATIDFEIEWEITYRQRAAWSTVKTMSPATHPKARMIDYGFEPGDADAFVRAMSARTLFLTDHRYQLPVEGFVALRGAPGHAAQVVFPVTWASFHQSDSMEAFVGSLHPDAAAKFRKLDRTLAQTISRIDHYDGDYAADLSFSPL